MQRFLIYLFLQTLYMFQAVPPPIIRSTKLYNIAFRYCQLILLLTAVLANSMYSCMYNYVPLMMGGGKA